MDYPSDGLYQPSSSHGSVPKWLEDMSDNLQKNRPGSWKLGLSNVSTPNVDLRSELSANLLQRTTLEFDQSMVNNLGVDLRRVSCGTEDMYSSREVSAKHGRRAVSETDTTSVGGSPRKTSFSPGNSDITSNVGLANNITLSPLHERSTPTINQTTLEPSPRHVGAESARGRRPREAVERDKSLEQSWSSLNFFNKRHEGRISVDQEGGVASPSDPVNGSTACLPSTPTDFIIPELPSGSSLEINIRTTWGDRHYLGLNGIELFCHTGEPVPVDKIWADPPDINLLPEYGTDPRVVTNLLDGVNRTHDDMHVWLAPFTENNAHMIYFTFREQVHIAMIRIWNYNKSRIHSYRGARDVDISLDKVLIFRGEIARACGGIRGGTEAFGDTILFTTDESILELISRHDDSFNSLLSETRQDAETSQIERPITGDRGDVRPFTGAVGGAPARLDSAVSVFSERLFGGQTLEINLLANWGHPYCIGLTGVEVFGDSGSTIPLDPGNLTCTSARLQCGRLADGVNVTTDEDHMWRSDYVQGQPPIVVSLHFPVTVFVAAMRLWNYNASQDMSYCGVRLLSVTLDKRLLTDVVTVRRAPGNCHFNFSQDILLSTPAPPSPLPLPLRETYIGAGESMPDLHDVGGEGGSTRRDGEGDYETAAMPNGFIFQLLILSTWGDPYYVGLNGLELYDHLGDRIPLTDNNIGAFPDSVNVLEGVTDDIRTPDKLIDGVNETTDGRHMWLAPVLPSLLNRVYIIFDYPLTVSVIKLWNYSKTPSRGVKEFEVLVDDLLIYNGVLDKYNATALEVPYRTVLFTTDEDLLIQERASQVRHLSCSDDVELLNDQHRVTSGGTHLSADQSQRPLTAIPSARAPIRSLHHL